MKKNSVLRRLLMAAALVCLPPSLMAGGPVTLNIHLADGTTQSVQLYTRPQVTFEGDRVVFTSPVVTFSYDAQQVLRFTYSGRDMPTGIAEADAGTPFSQQGEHLLFDASVKVADIQLFTDDGKRLPVSLQTDGGRPVLSLSALPAGVYLVSINGRTSKIVKR